jgi:two-component system CheB/CheR fusion protein
MRSRLLAMAGDRPQVLSDTREDELLEHAFEHRTDAEVLLDARGNLLAANAQARSTFNIPSTSLGRPFQDAELSYRPVELRSWIDQAHNERRSVQLKEVERWSQSGEASYLDIDVIPLGSDDGQHFGTLLTFTEVTRHRRLAEELESTHRELETAYEELQSSNEELETTNEELQSTIEELETTNEELQSTNEELETMNEELSSTNEELQAINEELRERTGELNQVNAYMESILTSLEAAIVVVDTDLLVRVWNGRSFEMWGLRAEEVEGRNFLRLDVGLPVSELTEPLRSCLLGKRPEPLPQLIGMTRRGVRTHFRVQLSPLLGTGEEVEGAIILIEDRGPAD